MPGHLQRLNGDQKQIVHEQVTTQYESINNKPWDNANYTKNDNYALLIGA